MGCGPACARRKRRDAALALGRIGKAAVPALLEALQDPRAHVRGAAALGLGRVGPEARAAAPALAVALDDPDPEVCRHAADALVRIGQDAVPAVAEALRRCGEDGRAWAALVLDRLGHAGPLAAARTGGPSARVLTSSEHFPAR